MLAVILIAFRNLAKNLRKSSLLATAMFLCSTILLVAFFSFNGVERQTLRNYTNVQAGHVIVLWDALADSDRTSPQRFINVYEPLTYDPAQETDNQAALAITEDYLTAHRDQLDRSFPIIRRNAVIEAGDTTDTTFLTYSLTPEQIEFLQDNRALELSRGSFPEADSDEVVISQDKAANLGLDVGDQIAITTLTDDTTMLETEFTVSGIYVDGAFYENLYGFIDQQTAQRIYAVPDGYYDSNLLFLHDRDDAQGFADALQSELQEASSVMHAESYLDANTFYNNTPQMIKTVFAAFIIFVLLIIAMGMQSSVKMSLYQRMKEIGSMRAIGFGKGLVYAMVFLETLFLAVAAFLPAAALALIYAMVFNSRGIFVGPAASALFGGQYFYPEADPLQFVFVLVVIVGFALLSTIRPGMAMVNQTIVDLMARRLKSSRQRRREAGFVRAA